ncbi:hypothetical protein pdam_00021306 [Pocillopora damicornis]|uniref:F5/8 type C domain-containing protein n=1 Tax=Pocillopora damicornis TaxID=46731 RepID=A0A3M6UUQ7_POCDA|nr:hypothetical protein pdam_00021306 [Pocillopora damicornis]
MEAQVWQIVMIKIQERRKISGHIDELYKKYLTTDETRYTEIFICVDNEMYQKFNRDKNVIKDRVITLVNTVDAIYQRINIRIVLKYLEIWTNGDPFGRVRNSATELKNFMAYRNKHLVKRFPHDNALLLSHKSWPPNIVGLAWVNTMCGGYSNSINAWYYESSVGPHATVAHELGHNFGFNHDSGTCKCLSSRGCFMGGSRSRLPGFSDCSLKSLQKVNDACLYNVPTYKAYNSYCGNGIREEGEECDCGTPEFKKRGTLCRGVQTDCDVPEYCTGSSRDVIHGNTNLNGVVARDLNPMVNARYLRINPQYWHGWPCLRTDFMGCSAHEGNGMLQCYSTLLIISRHLWLLCHDVIHGNTNFYGVVARDLNPMVNARYLRINPQYWHGWPCLRTDFMGCSAGEDGLLRHACSGKLVCPENGGTHNGAKIVVSRTCKVADSKLVRTVGRSLKHVKSGRCIHTSGAWPGNGRQMVLWSGCKEQRLQLWFGKQDCVEPLGMQNGEIKDRQITASSVRGQELAYYARLRGKKYWCAKAKSKTEYLQVDLGKVKTVSKILMQGRGNWYDWVTGFFLHYSSDGQRWKTYSASGDEKQSDSFCYLGKCSETLDTQCKDLWGANCVEPLGMQNGEIKDRQITASSVRGQEFAYYARLRGKNYWCAEAKRKTEYLQVDLGKVKTVSKILMQGRGSWYYWVTGFFLHYSSDGRRWKTYSASGDGKQSDVIHGNTNFYGVVARDLNPMVNARYLRINPQYWNGWPCLRTDFMGCSADEVRPTAPSPIKSYNLDFCLTPSSKSCSPRDNDPIIFVTGSRCSERHFQFTRGKDGLLRHACSGKLVCPENGGTHNGAKIVVSRTCKVADSKFLRVVGRSLKHAKSGRCIHTSGAWPGNGRQMVLWSGCEEQRLQLFFGKQDCVEPLGMQNGEIKDRQITASSVRAEEFAKYARLKGKKYWCAKAKSKTEYLQVDLGKVKTVSKILMQGRGNWYDWVTGFFLHYSSDGRRWKTYAQSGDEKKSDSFCYLGKCSETLDTQCKDLWGARCYDKLNTEARGYGTCDPNTKKRCAASDVLCGQLQCEADESRKKPVVDYGRARDKKIILPSGKKCNAVQLKGGDSIGLGMVRDGTKCGRNKMCINNKCQSLSSLNLVGKCPVVGNKECAGRGVCTNKKVCHCQGGFNPRNGCTSGESEENPEHSGGGGESGDDEDDMREEDDEMEEEYEDDEKVGKYEEEDHEEYQEVFFGDK